MLSRIRHLILVWTYKKSSYFSLFCLKGVLMATQKETGAEKPAMQDIIKSSTDIFHHAMTTQASDHHRAGAARIYLDKHECLIVVGGDDFDGKVLDSMDIYKDDGMHYQGPPLSKPRQRFGMASSCVDRFVYCAGGNDKHGKALDTVEILTFGHKGHPVGVSLRQIPPPTATATATGAANATAAATATASATASGAATGAP